MKLKTRVPDGLRSPSNRPKVSFNVDGEMLSSKDSDSDPLPIVELKPFVQKVWRREKSLPSFYDKSRGNHGVTRNTTGSRNKDTEPVVEIAPEQFSPPPPRTSHSLPATFPTQRLFQFQHTVLNEKKSSKEPSLSSLSSDSGFRPKSRIHPTVDSKSRRHPEYSVSLIPGFITREDREKTTLNDISDGDFMTRAYSVSPKTISLEDLKKHQDIEISGENVIRVLNPKSYTCPNSWRANGSYQGVRHGSPASMLYFHRPTHQRGSRKPENVVYDHLDRKGVLPSLTVQAKSLKQRTSPQYDENFSEDYRDYRDAYDVRSSRPNVGGIENSLKVLSEQGAPTKVERMLTFQLELNLNKFRSCRDYSPLETSPSELAKYYSTPTFNLTQGEVDIRKGLQSNTSKRTKGQLRYAGSLSTEKLKSLSKPTVSQKLHNKTNNRFEPFTSFENTMQEYGLFERNDSRGMSLNDRERTNMTITTDDELIVPNDTPRTYIDSRISFKPTEVAIEEYSQGTELRTPQEDTDRKESKRLGKDNIKTASRESPGFENKIQNDTVPQNVDMDKENIGSGELFVKQVGCEGTGKTFITLDKQAYVTVTG